MAAIRRGVEAFSRILLSYTLSMIPGRKQVLPNVLTHVGPSGEFHVVGCGHASGLPPIAGAGLQEWLTQFDVALKNELSALAQQCGLMLFHAGLWRRYAQSAVMKRA